MRHYFDQLLLLTMLLSENDKLKQNVELDVDFQNGDVLKDCLQSVKIQMYLMKR